MHEKRQKGEKRSNLLSKTIHLLFFCFLLHLQINSAWRVKKKKKQPLRRGRQPRQWIAAAQTNHLSDSESETTHTGADMQTNARTCPAVCLHKWGRKGWGGGRKKKKKSLTGCRPSLFVCREKSWEKQHKWVWEIMQSKTMSVAGGGRGEDVGTSDLKPRDGAC